MTVSFKLTERVRPVLLVLLAFLIITATLLPYLLTQIIEKKIAAATGLTIQVDNLNLLKFDGWVPRVTPSAQQVVVMLPSMTNPSLRASELQIALNWRALFDGKFRLQSVDLGSLELTCSESEWAWAKSRLKTSKSKRGKWRVNAIHINSLVIHSEYGDVTGQITAEGLGPDGKGEVWARLVFKDSEAIVAVRGNYEDGYSLTASGQGGKGESTFVPSTKGIEFEGKGKLPNIARFSDVTIEGKLSAERGKSQRWRGTWNGNVSGRYRLSGTPSYFSFQSEASYQDGEATVGISSFEIGGLHNGIPWSAKVPAVNATYSNSEFSISLDSPAQICYAGRPFSIQGRFEMDSAGQGRTSDFQVARIPLDVSVSMTSGKFDRSEVIMESVALTKLIPLFPKDVSALLSRATLRGSISGKFVYSSDNQLDGEIQLRVNRFHDRKSGFEIHNLRADIPIRQKFVDRSNVFLISSEEKWPSSLPFNVRVGKVARYNVEATDIKARSIFSHYVLRVYNVGFRFLKADGQCTVVMDPFREKDGRLRTAVYLDVERLGLRNLYEAFIGKAPDANSLKGQFDVHFASEWSDTESLRAEGSIVSTSEGLLGTRVIKALVDMIPAADRPPDVALFILGDYKFSSMNLNLIRDPSIHDFMTSLQLIAPGDPPPIRRTGNTYPKAEPLLIDFDVEVPLATLLLGLPVEVKSEIRRADHRR